MRQITEWPADDWRAWDTARSVLRRAHPQFTADQWETLEACALQNAADVAAEDDPSACAIETLRQYATGELDYPG